MEHVITIAVSTAVLSFIFSSFIYERRQEKQNKEQQHLKTIESIESKIQAINYKIARLEASQEYKGIKDK